MDRRYFLKLSANTALYGAVTATIAPQAWSNTSNKKLSATALELAREDALGQALLFKSGEVGALEMVDAAIERIEAFDPAINSVVYKAYDYAREAALRVSKKGDFAGVPYLLKSLERKQAMPHTNSSRFFAKEIAQKSDPTTVTVDASGMIYLGNANAPEFGLISSTAPSLYGSTNNPWDLMRSPGGSSGGSGAAVAAGLVPIATADDGGGSIRIPAGMCGTVGLKYSRGREVGHEDSILVNTACESRSVRDTAAFLNAIENKSHATLRPVGTITAPAKKRLRIAWTAVGNNKAFTPHPDVVDGVEKTARLLASLGHHVEESRFGVDGEEFWHHFMALWTAEPAELKATAEKKFGRAADERDFEAWTLGLAAMNKKLYDEQSIPKALAYFSILQENYSQWMCRYDIQLTPVTQTPAPLTSAQDPRRTDFDALLSEVTGWVNYTALQNAVGTPSISLPLYTSPTGLPVGSLLSAKMGAEATLLHLAYELEQALPWKERWAPHSVFS